MARPDGPVAVWFHRGVRRWRWAIVLVVVLVAGVVLVWFEPQALLLDERVEDVAPTPPPSAGEQPGERRGELVSLDHRTSGVVRVVGDVVRFEGLATDNGPDLYVYLSTNPVDGEEQAFDDEYVSLGRLKGNLGDQNYELPAGTDLARYPTVVIWCDRFNSAFGAASLTTA
jgi:hypothetical protein